MQKKIIVICSVVGVVLIGIIIIFTRSNNQPKAVAVVARNPMNATYQIDNQPVTLRNGVFEQTTGTGVTQKIVTRIFGESEYGDLNGDAKSEMVLFLRRDTGGSGTFFYVAAARLDGTEWKGSNALLLGDRIFPQSVQISKGLITVRYVDRRPEDPFTTPPSIRMTKQFMLNGDTLVDKK
jgi:hypothetical protein